MKLSSKECRTYRDGTGQEEPKQLICAHFKNNMTRGNILPGTPLFCNKRIVGIHIEKDGPSINNTHIFQKLSYFTKWIKHYTDIRNDNYKPRPKFIAPYLVRINESSDYWKCDGVIINEKWVLTVSNCLERSHGETIKISTIRETYEAEVKIGPPSYSYRQGVRPVDIGLLKVIGKIKLDANVKPSPIDFNGGKNLKNCVSISTTDNKFRNNMKFIPKKDCDASNPDVTICASYMDKELTNDLKKASPLICNNLVVGLYVSWHYRKRTGEDLLIYSNISSFKDVIESFIK